MQPSGPTSPARRMPGLGVAALASLGAGAVHAAAIGIHAEDTQVAQVFVVLAAAQLAAGLAALRVARRATAAAVAVVNAVAVGGWVVTRLAGIPFVEGLEVREAAQFADTACALMGALAVGGAGAALLIGSRPASAPRLAVPALLVAALTVPAMWAGGTDLHVHGETAAAAHGDGSDHPHDTTASGDATGGGSDAAHAHDGSWPRPWDPTQEIDFSGVEGVTIDQQRRAEQLAAATLRELPRWADTATAVADGFRSIGDASTGAEHFVKYEYINDGRFLDPRYPESLVYTVDGDRRILAGAMFIASARPTDDPSLAEFAGPLMTWHNHGDLCWDIVNGVPAVVGTTRATGSCERGTNTGGENPMVHVWITPHQCGPFAALEGVGMGQAAVSDEDRVDLCHDDHGHGGSSTPKPYDPTKPIDLSGTPGVTPEQQAAAENLIAITLVRLPKWADYRAAEAAGFHSIRDGATGYEHFIQWDWINDDVWLDPDYPESLVYRRLPDGSRQLVSAMYMLPDTVPLSDVPDIGGALMQWHIHDDLCFSDDPVAPVVMGLTRPDGSCADGLVKFAPSPMIHVWIVPHTCGPFAALEGLGAGQILEGEERLCDHLHGSDA